LDGFAEVDAEGGDGVFGVVVLLLLGLQILLLVVRHVVLLQPDLLEPFGFGTGNGEEVVV
jgi:hypothetical protein